MHVPSYMLHGAICPVTAGVAAVGLTAASYAAYKCKEKPSVLAFGAVSSLVFGAQMLNFPILHGTSGHLLGGVLAANLLGTPFAVLAISIVLAVQSVFFADGGLNTLGANFINMGLIGAGLGGCLLYALRKKGMNNIAALSLASWISVTVAASACSLELATSNIGRLNQILSVMLPVHALIGLGEAFLTVVLTLAIQRAGIARYAKTSVFFAVVAALLSPVSSPLPDGLTWVSTYMRLANFEAIKYQAIFSQYHVSGTNSYVLSTMIAALTGISLTFFVALMVAWMITRRGICKISI